MIYLVPKLILFVFCLQFSYAFSQVRFITHNSIPHCGRETSVSGAHCESSSFRTCIQRLLPSATPCRITHPHRLMRAVFWQATGITLEKNKKAWQLSTFPPLREAVSSTLEGLTSVFERRSASAKAAAPFLVLFASI
jgi:hypothetical protein